MKNDQNKKSHNFGDKKKFSGGADKENILGQIFTFKDPKINYHDKTVVPQAEKVQLKILTDGPEKYYIKKKLEEIYFTTVNVSTYEILCFLKKQTNTIGNIELEEFANINDTPINVSGSSSNSGSSYDQYNNNSNNPLSNLTNEDLEQNDDEYKITLLYALRCCLFAYQGLSHEEHCQHNPKNKIKDSDRVERDLNLIQKQTIFNTEEKEKMTSINVDEKNLLYVIIIEIQILNNTILATSPPIILEIYNIIKENKEKKINNYSSKTQKIKDKELQLELERMIIEIYNQLKQRKKYTFAKNFREKTLNILSILDHLLTSPETQKLKNNLSGINPNNNGGALGGGIKIMKGGFYSLQQINSLIKSKKINLNDSKKTKIENLIKFRNIYLKKEKYYKNKKIEKKKFNINVNYFSKNKQLLNNFTKYIFKSFLSPVKNYNMYNKKNKIYIKLEGEVEKYNNIYNIQNLSKNLGNENIVNFIIKKKQLNKEKNRIIKNLDKIKTAPNEIKNVNIDALKNKNLEILNYELNSIDKYPEIKKYELNKINNNKKVVKIQKFYDFLKRKIKKNKDFFKKIENKKKNFYTLNNLNLVYFQYIKNEIEILNTFNVELDKKIKLEFKKNIKRRYIFYYVLTKKFNIFLKKINTKKNIINEDFKNLYLEKENLKKQFDNNYFINNKKIILEKLKKNNIKIYFFKIIFYNLKIIIDFINDIILKCDYMLLIIEYFLSYLNNYTKICNILNLIIDKNKLLKIDFNKLKLPDIVKKNINTKELEIILSNIKTNFKYIYNNRLKLILKKNEINQEYNNIVDYTFNVSKNLKKKVFMVNKNKEDLIKNQKLKNLREEERNKIKYQDYINDLININSDYLLLTNPINLLIKTQYLFYKNKKLFVNYSKIKGEHNKKFTNKKLKKILKILEKNDEFNKNNHINPFVIINPENTTN